MGFHSAPPKFRLSSQTTGQSVNLNITLSWEVRGSILTSLLYISSRTGKSVKHEKTYKYTQSNLVRERRLRHLNRGPDKHSFVCMSYRRHFPIVSLPIARLSGLSVESYILFYRSLAEGYAPLWLYPISLKAS